jgi:S-adenosylmethionine hydrolase
VAQSIITLTTDYGTSDHLVGAMKGVILKINPEAHIVDICHNVLPFDVLDGALTIGQAYRFYPPRTVHIVVVDPGVGTARRPILVTGDQHYFVAPDNGVLSVVYEKEERLSVRRVSATHYFQNPVSNTFHGRDIFAPVAAWLTKNWQTPSFGEEITDYVRFTLPKPRIADNTVKGVVMRVDTFGNLVTNLTPEDVPQLLAGGKSFKISVGGKEVSKFHQAYGQGEQGEVFALLGSSGFLEISMNRGNAARTLGAQRGSPVTLETA